MGIVKRQSVKFSIISYIALFLGTVNVLFIYPFALKPDELGLVRFVLEAAMMIVPFISLGFGNVVIRFFPYFQNASNKHNGFLFIIYAVPLISFIFFFLIFLIFKTDVFNYYASKNELFSKNLIFIIPLTCFILVANLSQNYCYNFQRIVVPNIFNNLLIKITLPALALLYYYKFIALTELNLGVVITYLVIVIGFILYIKSLGQFSLKPKFSFLNKVKLKEIGVYSMYGILSGVGSVLALRIDTFMIASMVDLTNTGIYTIAVFIAGVIAVPYNAVVNIGASLISKSLAINDIKSIDEIYKKSSLILLITGSFLLLFIWFSLDDFFEIMPNGDLYKSGKYVVLILGIAKLIDITASVNDQIINYSKYFRFNFYAILILAALNLINNFILIPKFQIIGAASATLISITVYNLIKLLYIKYKFNIQPLSRGTIYVLIIGLVSYTIVYFIPDLSNPFFNVAVNGIVLSILFLGPVYYLKLSEDLNDVALKLLNRIRRHLFF